MLSREDNERLTRVGPGTPMGELMRRYWLPALPVAALPAPDCPPVRVRLLGEDLVAFRDSDGRVGLLDEYCPHRCASLFLGRNEERGLRCVYHGWKFDVAGNCVDLPNEPPEYRFTFQAKIHQTAYPTVELAGLIWTYMGPPAKQPPLPDMEWMRAPASHRFVSRTFEECNWLQALEGGIDTVHSSFLHNNDLADQTGFGQIDTHPRLEVEPTPYGFRYAGIRDVGERGHYVRIYHFVLPFQQFRSSQLVKKGGGRAPVPQNRGHLWVPIDDENTMVYNWIHALEDDKPLTPALLERYEREAGRGPEGETTIRRRTRANNWLIDRDVQRAQTFTGIEGVNTEDLAVQESMGRIVDRSREHLGSTDRAIITCRRILLELTRTVEAGDDPLGLDPATYRHVRATDVVLPKGVPWQEAAAEELAARR